VGGLAGAVIIFLVLVPLASRGEPAAARTPVPSFLCWDALARRQDLQLAANMPPPPPGGSGSRYGFAYFAWQSARSDAETALDKIEIEVRQYCPGVHIPITPIATVARVDAVATVVPIPTVSPAIVVTVFVTVPAPLPSPPPVVTRQPATR